MGQPPTRPEAPFARVKRELKAALSAGQYPAGRQMPSEAELVAHFGVSRMTVNRALRELHEEIVARGHPHRATVHHCQAERAPAAAPGHLDADFTRQTPTHVLFQMTEPWRAQYRIEAARHTLDEARLLGVPADEPCLVIHRRTASREAAITNAQPVQPGSRYTFAGEFSP
ncbi:MAG: GntR family transcriptional regulator [Rubrivivax sp.]